MSKSKMRFAGKVSLVSVLAAASITSALGNIPLGDRLGLQVASAEAAEQTSSPAKGDIYEAEEAGAMEGIIIDTKHAGYTGAGFTDYNPNAPGGYIEWTIDVPAAGEYTLEFRYGHGGTDKRPAAISVNGEVVEEELAFDPTGDWTNWLTISTKAELKAGKNVIRATGAGASGGANIDHMRVYQEIDIVAEAEEADAMEGVIVDTKHAGYTGAGFTDYNPNAPGGYLEWKIDMPAAGDYTLEFRYAHGGSDKRPAAISVNGKEAAAELAFDPTGGWDVWLTTSMPVSLQEGENVIRATGAGASGGANIDHLRIHNKPNGGEETAPLEVVELSELVSGLQLKQLKELGLIAGEERQDDEPISRLEWMSLVNDTFGFVHQERFVGLGVEKSVWEVSLEEWYAYVFEAAKQAGYVKGFPDGTIRPDEPMTRQEVAVMVAGLLDLAPNPKAAGGFGKLPDWSNGAIGAVAAEGYMTGAGGGFSPAKPFTVGEAKELAAEIAKRHEVEAPRVRIVAAQAVADNLVAVTLNSRFDAFDFEDISISVPTGSWDTLTPNLKELRLSRAAQGVNRLGQTVLLYESLDKWDGDVRFEAEAAEPKFTGDLDAATRQADNMVSWQMEHGGFSKAIDYSKPWDGKSKRSEWQGPNGEDLGMIDNDATVKELQFLAQIYQETGDAAYKEAILKGFEFLFLLQTDTGGFPQVYPKRGNPGDNVQYSNAVTFNDNAMINVLDLMEDAAERSYPFGGDLISDELAAKLRTSMADGLNYILKAQIQVDGQLQGWGAQHDPVTYEAVGARAYEHASLSGSEAVGIVRYLMARPDQTPEIKRAIQAALAWFDEVKLEGIRYVSADPNGVYFVEDPNTTSWYRFYEIGTNEPIFSGRDGVKKRTIQEIEQERRDGYSWGGNYAEQLLETASTTGYFPGRVYAEVTAAASKDGSGRTLATGDIRQVTSLTKQLSELQNELTVAQDGTGDYRTVQAAIDAVPAGNGAPVTIHVKNGIYKEVVRIPSDKPFITLVGEDSQKTVITYDNYSGRDNGAGGTFGTSGSATAFIQANDVTVRNMTFENSTDESKVTEKDKQAVAMNVRGDRVSFANVRFLGNQDTLLTNGGTQYFSQCYIEGDVDFIFGGSRAVFDDCTIHSLDRGSDTNNGYITAASTLIEEPYGYLILNSRLTSDAPAGTVYLGRPWHPSGNPNAIASVVFMNTEMGPHIKDEPWTDMSGFSWKEARFAEYKNTGEGAVVNEFRKQLTDEEAAEWTVENVLKGWDPKQAE
ncbi:pectate lyase [Paenibacillus soyae]|uniref:Pectate lyase n=1 Tax=Paenibacillus soyae TaxID=2969249 RepID=A0A9X2MUR5_9BACL|nr:pectate lyase [Paenibacillus soyae]MCR2807386.1 pectate lyase [Paenibacillus soyae]